MTPILFTADDYSILQAIDNGIISMAKKGLINSVAALTNGNHSARQIDFLMQECPNIELGCHLTITSGKPLLGDQVSSLTTNNGYFRNYKEYQRAIDTSELYNELKAQTEFIEQLGHAVKHLSVHHNSLYFYPEHFDVLVNLGVEKNIPIRSVDIRPVIKDSLYSLLLNLYLTDDLSIQDRSDLLEFRSTIENYVVNSGNGIKMPAYVESSHYVTKSNLKNGTWSYKTVKKHAKNKMKKLMKLWRKVSGNHPIEFMFHLIHNNYYSLNLYKQQMRSLDYPGIDPNYFDGRLAELRSLNGFKKEALDDYGIKPASWNNIP